MRMKDAFDVYFENIRKNWQEKRNCMPKRPCRIKDIDKPDSLFVVGTRDEEGYAEWQPKLQNKKIDFDACEKALGFCIHPQIKSYVSTYYFESLEGELFHNGKSLSMQLDKILPSYNMEQYIIGSFDKSETHYLSTGDYFLIGSYCCYDYDDSYLIHVNNDNGEVYIVQVEDRISIKIANSIEELLRNMRGIW